MLELQDLLSPLGYDTSLHYCHSEKEFEPEAAHVFRSARIAGVDGAYVVQTSSSRSASKLPSRPAVFVAVADTEDRAREIHRKIWNIGSAPFLLVVLPNQIKVYTAFEYSPTMITSPGEGNRERGLLHTCHDRLKIVSELADFSAAAIDAGQIWESRFYLQRIDTQLRVDARLLKNLITLDEKLQTRMGLAPDIAHALIGKYVYIRYLRDRKILSDEWLIEHHIDRRSVFEREATVTGLARLVDALEVRFNGKIFPVNLIGAHAPEDRHVRLVASVFMGDEIIGWKDDAIIQQLHLDFQAYQFDYIPIETLSSVYEQFIDDRKLKGAVYTPEILADYLISQMSVVKKLTPEMTVLDPACGSGVFLVLALRRLIEQHIALQANGRIALVTLVGLLSNLYGVERELDACYVTEFSLLLTILHYIDPPELHKNAAFQFPSLHNTQIFHGDFFDDSLKIWSTRLCFNWIVGNPPWVKAARGQADPDSTAHQKYASNWIDANASLFPVGNRSVAEAFSWRVGDALKDDGLVGLIMPATSLVNVNSQKYRAEFFTAYEIFRLTNFANFRRYLFGNRRDGSEFPASTIVFAKTSNEQAKVEIVHYGPFSVNQIPRLKGVPWALVINEDEIQTIAPQDAEKGETTTWKLALWGSHRDRRALERLKWLFPTTLEQYCALQGWGANLPEVGPQLRDGEGAGTNRASKSDKLANTKVIDMLRYRRGIRYRFWLPDNLLIPNTKEYVRMRGGSTAVRLTRAPHIFISSGWDLIVYSDDDFVIPPRQIGITAVATAKGIHLTEDDLALHRRSLKALCLYLNSTLIKYYLFFHVPEWGIDRRRDSVVVSEVRKIPTPVFTKEQMAQLATLYDELVRDEQAARFNNAAHLQATLFDESNQDACDSNKDHSDLSIEALHGRQQKKIDYTVYEVCGVPEDIRLLASDFIDTRLLLNEDKQGADKATRIPTSEEFTQYAKQIQTEINDFLMGDHHPSVAITWSKELTECIVELPHEGGGNEGRCSVQTGALSHAQVLASISADLRQQISQWTYIQRGLRLYDGPRVYLYKSTRLINWTRTQAMNDAADIIANSIQARMES